MNVSRLALRSLDHFPKMIVFHRVAAHSMEVYKLFCYAFGPDSALMKQTDKTRTKMLVIDFMDKLRGTNTFNITFEGTVLLYHRYYALPLRHETSSMM